MTTLLLSSRHTDDNQALWRAAISRDWTVVRTRGIHIPEFADSEVVIYIEAMFAPTIAKMIGQRLLDPPPDWLTRLSPEFTKRRIVISNLKRARQCTYPAFIKPPNDKLFAAKVYESAFDLPTDYDDDMAVLIAEPVEWESEFRCFCLDGEVRTLSPYLRAGVLASQTNFSASAEELQLAKVFAEQVLAATALWTPRAIVIDVGQVVGKGWAVVEANAAWGSGIYGCDPDRVLDVIRYAATPAR